MTTAAASVIAVTPAAYSPQFPFARAIMGTTVITGSDMSTPADSDWSLTQAALDAYIAGGIERLKRTPKHITGHLASS